MAYDIIAYTSLGPREQSNSKYQRMWRGSGLIIERYTTNDKNAKRGFMTRHFKVQSHALRLGNEKYGDWTFFARLVMHFGINYSTLFAGSSLQEIEVNRDAGIKMIQDFHKALNDNTYMYLRFPVENFLKLVRPRRGNSYLDFQSLSGCRYASTKPNSCLAGVLGDLVRVELESGMLKLTSMTNTNITRSQFNPYAITGLRVISVQDIRNKFEEINRQKNSIIVTSSTSTKLQQKVPEMQNQDEFAIMQDLVNEITELEGKIAARKSELRKIHDEVSARMQKIKNVINR